MAKTQDIDQLLSEIGSFVDEIILITQYSSTFWRIVFEGNKFIDAKLDDETGRLTISSRVATVPDELSKDLFKMALLYNFIWSKTGGTTLSLSPSEDVVMSVHLQEDDLEISRFCSILKSLLIKSNGWQEILDATKNAPSEAEIPSAMTSTLEAESTIRV